MEQLKDTSMSNNAPAIVFEENDNEFKSPGMNFLEEQINEFTEYKSPPPISFEENKEEKPATEASGKIELSAEKPKEKKPIDEKAMGFTVDMFVEMFDTSQYGLFLALNKRKQVRKLFGDKDSFNMAEESSLLTDEEISKLPADQQLQVKAQKKRYDRFVENMTDKYDEISLTDKERGFLERPLKELCRRNGLDLPPGWALGFGIFNVFSNRMIDLMMD